MSSATEPMHAGEFASDIEEDSNDKVTVLSGQTLVAGEVVGKVIIAGVGRVSVPTVVGTGNGTCTLVTAGPLCQVGSYVATCTAAATHGGVFTVVAGSCTTVGTLTLTGGTNATTAFKSPHLNFSLTDGSTDFIVSDAFTFVVGTTVPAVIGTGNGVISAITYGSRVQTGNYRIENVLAVTNGGHFKVVAPDGTQVASGAVTAGASGTMVVASSDHLNFTITENTDFALGDYFNVAVYGPAAAPKVVQYDPQPTTFDGRHRVAGIAWDAYDASGGDVKGVITCRKATVKADALTWKSTLHASEKVFGKSALTALGVVVR